MKDEGMLDEYLAKFDWMAFDFDKTSQEVIERMAEPTIKFFKTHTKAELFEGALKRRIFLYPVSNAKDIVENQQLAARDFWVKIEHPELGESINYPGPFVKVSEAPLALRRRAPLIGEHNIEIYEQELGISRKELLILKQTGII
jgi:crotonobetainyl-CoA:carnitine CoA-transferase CaiB-like acyl-CoA transferase